MGVWLGKNVLGQTDEVRHEINGQHPLIIVLGRPAAASAANQIEEPEEALTIDVSSRLMS